MKIIDGKDAVLGRLASFAAKEALKGEEIVILNCEKVKITGSRKEIIESFKEKRTRVGSGQKGPKISRLSEEIVKRAVRGMVSDFREGKGKEAYKRVKCYVGIPKEFEKEKKISAGRATRIKNKFIRVEELAK